MKEKLIGKHKNGMPFLILFVLLYLAAIPLLVAGGIGLDAPRITVGTVVMFVAGIAIVTFGWIGFLGLKVVKPQEALVLTLFGNYVGTLREPGFYFVNPFCVAVNPAATTKLAQSSEPAEKVAGSLGALNAALNSSSGSSTRGKAVSLKTMTLSNGRQKINDSQGNPVEVGIAVTWRVVDTAKAVFDVDNYKEYLSLQCDSSLRNIVRLYPYDLPFGSKDVNGEADEQTLRGSSDAIARKIRDEIQVKVESAGLEILDARITHLAYAPEIAAAMLQRQQANAVVSAREAIVEGAVGMVEMALRRMDESDLVELDDERRAAMVSNLLVVLCANHDAQPIVNSGSLY